MPHPKSNAESFAPSFAFPDRDEPAELLLTLEYPAAWQRPKNPLASAAAAFTHRFLERAGLLEDPAVAEKLVQMDVAGYGGWPFSQAGLFTLQTVTAFLTLWILHDDQLEGRGETDPESVVRAVRGDGPRPEQPFHGAWWELGQRSRLRRGAAATARHGERFRAWLSSLEVEAALVARERRGDPCRFDEYMEWRRINVGVLPTLDFLELDLGAELPEILWRDPRVPVLERLAADIVALQNDLYGYRKDVRDGWPNAVRQVEAAGLPADQAIEWVAARHNELVAELDRRGRALLREEDGGRLANWWRRLSGLVAGFAFWHADAARYGGAFLAGGKRVRLEIDQLPETAEVFVLAPAFSGAEFFS